MIFGVMIRHKKILTHTKFDQVWLGNSQEEWICRSGLAIVFPNGIKFPLISGNQAGGRPTGIYQGQYRWKAKRDPDDRVILYSKFRGYRKTFKVSKK